MKLELTDIIKRPLLSEKSVFLGTHRNAYSFQVDRRADKTSIRQAIEEIYHVKVSEVRTSVVPGRSRRSKTRLPNDAGVEKSGGSGTSGPQVGYLLKDRAPPAEPPLPGGKSPAPVRRGKRDHHAD
jgi:ribosomal protein L23